MPPRFGFGLRRFYPVRQYCPNYKEKTAKPRCNFQPVFGMTGPAAGKLPDPIWRFSRLISGMHSRKMSHERKELHVRIERR